MTIKHQDLLIPKTDNEQLERYVKHYTESYYSKFVKPTESDRSSNHNISIYRAVESSSRYCFIEMLRMHSGGEIVGSVGENHELCNNLFFSRLGKFVDVDCDFTFLG